MVGYLTELATKIDKHFSVEELEELCFKLDVDAENVLLGDSKSKKAISLVQHFNKNEQILKLVAELRVIRPNVLWPYSIEIDMCGVWWGAFCGDQAGNLSIHFTNGKLQADLITSCFNNTEVIHEKLEGQVAGRELLLEGNNVFRTDSFSMPSYCRDSFRLVLLEDGRCLDGGVKDDQGKEYSAVFIKRS